MPDVIVVIGDKPKPKGGSKPGSKAGKKADHIGNKAGSKPAKPTRPPSHHPRPSRPSTRPSYPSRPANRPVHNPAASPRPLPSASPYDNPVSPSRYRLYDGPTLTAPSPNGLRCCNSPLDASSAVNTDKLTINIGVGVNIIAPSIGLGAEIGIAFTYDSKGSEHTISVYGNVFAGTGGGAGIGPKGPGLGASYSSTPEGLSFSKTPQTMFVVPGASAAFSHAENGNVTGGSGSAGGIGLGVAHGYSYGVTYTSPPLFRDAKTSTGYRLR